MSYTLVVRKWGNLTQIGDALDTILHTMTKNDCHVSGNYLFVSEHVFYSILYIVLNLPWHKKMALLW